MSPTEEVIERARELASRLFRLQPMRRGSLGERFVKCSKPGCACAEDPAARHGPYFSWTRQVGGSTRSKFLSAQQAAIVSRQIEAAHEFRRDLESFWELCEQWADAEVEPQEPSATEEVEKGGSGRVSLSSSGRRSRRSSPPGRSTD
jgi:hypothetical protein